MYIYIEYIWIYWYFTYMILNVPTWSECECILGRFEPNNRTAAQQSRSGASREQQTRATKFKCNIYN